MTQMAANPPLLAQSNNVGWRHEIDVIGSGGPTSNPIATIASASRLSASSTSNASNHQVGFISSSCLYTAWGQFHEIVELLRIDELRRTPVGPF